MIQTNRSHTLRGRQKHWVETKTLSCSLKIEKRDWRRDGRLSLLDLCVHYMMPSIPPSAKGWRHGNSCSSVTTETREMLDIKKWLIPTRLCLYLLCVWVTEWGLLFWYSWEQTFSGAKIWAGGTSWQRDTVFWNALSLTCFDSKYPATFRDVKHVQLPPRFPNSKKKSAK